MRTYLGTFRDENSATGKRIPPLPNRPQGQSTPARNENPKCCRAQNCSQYRRALLIMLMIAEPCPPAPSLPQDRGDRPVTGRGILSRLPIGTPLRRMTTFRRRCKDSEQSCAREIDVSSRGLRKRAWWPCGPAMQRFDQEIAPEIEGLLKNADLGDADIYLRLYMIGRSPARSRPVIMVCCSNAQVRTRAEEAIRTSQIPQAYPEFALGASALPLEQPGLVFALAGTSREAPMATPKARPGPLTYSDPLVGRRLCVLHKATILPTFRLATAGAVIQLGGIHYQITTSHIVDDAPASDPNPSDLNECHFDDTSDEEEGCMEDEGSLITLEHDANVSSCGRNSSPVATNAHGHSARSDQGPILPNLQPFGVQPGNACILRESLVHNSRDGPNPGLDYALVRLPVLGVTHNYRRSNGITVRKGNKQRTMTLHVAAAIPTQEKRVIVVSASRGVTHGVLSPGAVYFRNATLPRFQKLYPLCLQDSISLGDSGSVVVDEESGHVYGHVVRGIPGTMTAYAVSITEVFEDLQQRTGFVVQLAPLAKPLDILASADTQHTTPSAARPLVRTSVNDPWAPVSVPFPFVLRDTGNWDSVRNELGTPELSMTSDTGPSLYTSENDPQSMDSISLGTFHEVAAEAEIGSAGFNADYFSDLAGMGLDDASKPSDRTAPQMFEAGSRSNRVRGPLPSRHSHFEAD